MTSEDMRREYCKMESSANTSWGDVVDEAKVDTRGWIREMEIALYLLNRHGLGRAMSLFIAADKKVTAELFRINADLDDIGIIE